VTLYVQTQKLKGDAEGVLMLLRVRLGGAAEWVGGEGLGAKEVDLELRWFAVRGSEMRLFVAAPPLLPPPLRLQGTLLHS
jgi:hypothetical protein